MGLAVPAFTRPESFAPEHLIDAFDCGEESLNRWLREHARKSDGLSSRTFVVCVDRLVIGYYALSAGSVARIGTPGRMRRNMPDPIPVIVLGRFAVDRDHQGAGVGAGMLRDALLRSLNVAEAIGVRAVLLHSLTDSAKRFYMNHGFVESPLDPMTLMLPIETVRNAREPSH